MAVDPTKILEYLLEQRRLVDAAIASVERVVVARKPRGHPTKAVMEARRILGKQATPRKKKRDKRRESSTADPAAAS